MCARSRWSLRWSWSLQWPVPTCRMCLQCRALLLATTSQNIQKCHQSPVYQQLKWRILPRSGVASEVVITAMCCIGCTHCTWLWVYTSWASAVQYMINSMATTNETPNFITEMLQTEISYNTVGIYVHTYSMYVLFYLHQWNAAPGTHAKYIALNCVHFYVVDTCAPSDMYVYVTCPTRVKPNEWWGTVCTVGLAWACCCSTATVFTK